LLDDLDQRNTDLNLPLGKFRKQVIDSRIGQGEFRDKILERYGACIVTKVTEKSLLVASHIMPWRISKVDACLDENNGLLLSPHIDRLFDQGFISFADNGDLMVKDESIREVLKMWRIEYPLNVGSFNVKQKKYLKYHRTHIFKK
jgi:predicted restriction endonuclease